MLFILLWAACLHAAPTFIQQPAFVKGAGSVWTISFALSEYADVEVAVVDLRDSVIFRRLAAGKLGANPPAPFQANSLAQTLLWDGLDDFRRPIPVAANPSVRVRVGLSVSLDTFVNASPHQFSVTENGFCMEPNGDFYVFGNNGLYNGEFQSTMMTLRKFDRNGAYLKTVYPAPAGTIQSAVLPFGALALTGGGFRPKTYMTAGPGLGDLTVPISDNNGILCPFKVNGAMMIVNRPNNNNPVLEFVFIKPNSEFAGTGPLITSPALPLVHTLRGPWVSGPFYFSLWPDGKSILVSGLYQTNYSGTAWVPADTGFWRDGRIFRVDLTSGAATPFISFDPSDVPVSDSARRALIGPKWGTGYLQIMSAVHGTAFDDSGHVFVCDRAHQRLGVYDTNGLLLSSIPVADPDLVEVDERTGAIYVLARNITAYKVGYVHLYKYENWRNPVVAASKLNITKGLTISSSVPQLPRVHFALDNSGSVPVLWVASKSGDTEVQNGAWRIEDRGGALVQTFAFSDHVANSVADPDRLTVDPRSGTLYIQGPYTNLYKIENWKAPVLLPCSTAAGARIYAADMQISPAGFLYLRQQPGGGRSAYPVLDRWTLGHRHAPAPFLGLGTNIVTGILIEHFSNGVAAHGMDVYRDSLVAVMHRPFAGRYYVQVWDTAGTLVRDSVVSMTPYCGGLKYDRKGNLYVGALCWADSHAIPPDFAADRGYRNNVGTIIKFAPSATGGFSPNNYGSAGSPRDVNPLGALAVYANTPLAPLSGKDPCGPCVCRVPRFEIDPYGRIFTPNAITGSVSVTDNNDNLMLRFGEYGNRDSWGAASLAPTRDVPILWPSSAVADDEYVYVSDLGNSRVLRVKMNFALNSMPGFTGREAVQEIPAAFEAGLSPSPFNPAATLRLRLPFDDRLQVRVYDAQGRPVRTLHDGRARAGALALQWNGRDNQGRTVGAGVYMVSVSSGSQAKTLRAVYVK